MKLTCTKAMPHIKFDASTILECVPFDFLTRYHSVVTVAKVK